MNPQTLAIAKLCGINEPEILDKLEMSQSQNKYQQDKPSCPILQFLTDLSQARLIARAVRGAMPGTDNVMLILNTKLQSDTVGVVPYMKISSVCQQLGLDPHDALKWAAAKSNVYFPCIVCYERSDKKHVAMQFRLPYVDMNVVQELVHETGVTEEGAIMKELLERFTSSELLVGR